MGKPARFRVAPADAKAVLASPLVSTWLFARTLSQRQGICSGTGVSPHRDPFNGSKASKFGLRGPSVSGSPGWQDPQSFGSDALSYSPFIQQLNDRLYRGIIRGQAA